MNRDIQHVWIIREGVIQELKEIESGVSCTDAHCAAHSGESCLTFRLFALGSFHSLFERQDSFLTVSALGQRHAFLRVLCTINVGRFLGTLSGHAG